MRTAFCASALVLTSLACAATQRPGSVGLPAGGSVTYMAEQSQTRFDISASDHDYTVRVHRDATVPAQAGPARVEIVADLPHRALVLIDTYASFPGGMSLCQSGEERFLRIISIVKERAETTFSTKLASCRDNIELATPGVEWLSASSTLHVHWLEGPTKPGRPRELAIRIDSNGEPIPL
jgi:hypothetical protein